jgi:hypothetical protein
MSGVEEEEEDHKGEDHGVEEEDDDGEIENENTPEAEKNMFHQVLEAFYGLPGSEVEKNPPADKPNEATTKEGNEGASEKLPNDEKDQDHPVSPTYKLYYPRSNFSGTDRSPPKSVLKKKGKDIQKDEKEKRDKDKRRQTRKNVFDKRRMIAKQVLERQDEEFELN